MRVCGAGSLGMTICVGGVGMMVCGVGMMVHAVDIVGVGMLVSEWCGCDGNHVVWTVWV